MADATQDFNEETTQDAASETAPEASLPQDPSSPVDLSNELPGSTETAGASDQTSSGDDVTATSEPTDAEPEAAPEAEPEATPEADMSEPAAEPVALPENEGDAPAAKTEDHASDLPEGDSAPAAADSEGAEAGSDEADAGATDAPSVADKTDALLDKGEDNAQGEGATHNGTDTPETLTQNPADPVTGRPLDGSGMPAGVIVGGSGSLNQGVDFSSGSDDSSDDDVGSLENPVFGGSFGDDDSSDKASLVASMQDALSTLSDNLDKLASLD